MAISSLSRRNVTTASGARTHNIAAINTDRSEQEANARIIAAAPDLLAALKEAVNLLAWGDAFNADLPDAEPHEKNAAKAVAKFEAIIAKAEGTLG